MAEYYTSGQFAKKARITIRTVRFYDKEGLLKPDKLSDSGYRLYSDEDFIRLQRILFFKSLGFSLQEIRGMLDQEQSVDLTKSLTQQLRLLQVKIDQLKIMEQSIKNAILIAKEANTIDKEQMMHLLHLSNMDSALIEQYKNENNLTVRIALHEQYSENKTGWFPWLFDQITFSEGQQILELGCGNGKLWMTPRLKNLPKMSCLITDSSRGMVNDARKNIKEQIKEESIQAEFSFTIADCETMDWGPHSFDTVIANHLLFYVHDVEQVVEKVAKLLREGGCFYCSTYGPDHMKEIRMLVKEFDSEITLSEVALYEQFGLQNGKEILSPYFQTVEKKIYPDRLRIHRVEPLVDYILSCHGNQNERLAKRQNEFRQFIENKIKEKGEILVTKEAGIFLCRK